MKLSDIRTRLPTMETLRFRLPDGSYVPDHFHVTEVGLVTKHFIDCGGTERTETVANFQLWQDTDYDHRLAPQKFLRILDISKKILGEGDYEIEVEYQQATIGKFGLEYEGADFVLTPKHTDCLARDVCLPKAAPEASCCGSAKGCC